MSRYPVLVLGAGLAGLSASAHLRKLGVPHRVLERAGRVGGLAVTQEEAGYRFDRTGHLLHLRDPELDRWVRDLLGAGAYLEIERRSVVYSHGVVSRYPFQANVHGLPPEVAYRCTLGFVRAHFDPAPREVRTFEDFCLRHFGEGISEAFMIPYNQKLWGVHPREISADWCDRFVPQPSLEDVLKGAFGVGRSELGYNTRFLYPRLGIGELARSLAERAGQIDLDHEVTAVDLARRTVRAAGEEVPFGTLVSSLPLDALCARLVDAPPEIQAAAAKLRATSLHYVDLALNTPCEMPWHWVYVPEARYPFYRVGAYSNFSAAMAPTHKGSLYVELASREAPDLKALLPELAAALVDMGLIRAPEAIRFARARTIEHAYVIYDEARAAAVATLRGWLADQGVHLVGRYAKWEYAAMEDALADGKLAALTIAAEGRPS